MGAWGGGQTFMFHAVIVAQRSTLYQFMRKVNKSILTETRNKLITQDLKITVFR